MQPKIGEMPEWSNGAVSKTVELLVGSGGSNPPLSAEDEEKKLSSSLEQLFFFIFCKARRRRAGMCDEGDGLVASLRISQLKYFTTDYF